LISIYLFQSNNYPVLRGHAVKGGRSAWCPGGSAPAVRAHASHGRGAGGLSNGSCASSVCTPFAATSAAIGSGASAAAGAKTLGASRPWPEGARPLLVLSSSPAAAGVLGSVVSLGRHGEGVFEGCQPPRSAVLTDARAAYDTAPRRSIGYHPPGVSYPVAPLACGPHSRRRWMSLAASHAGAAVPYRDSPLRYTQRSMASPCSPPEVSGNRPRGWRPSRRTSGRWYRPHSQVHHDGQHAYWPQALSCIPLELPPFKKSPRMPIYTSREMAERHTTTG
jgi:hypothetical protein